MKIADFGLAREIRSKPPFTDYVSTRWYVTSDLPALHSDSTYPVQVSSTRDFAALYQLQQPSGLVGCGLHYG